MAEGFENRSGDKMSATNNKLDIEDKGLAPDNIIEGGVLPVDRTQERLDELRRNLKDADKGKPEKPGDLPPLKNGNGDKFRESKPDKLSTGELPSVLDEPEGPEEEGENVEDEPQKPEDDGEGDGKKGEGAKGKKEEGGEVEEKLPEGQRTTGEFLDRIVKGLNEKLGDKLSDEQKAVANEVVTIANSRLTPSELDAAYPNDQYEAKGKLNPLAIYRDLETLSRAFYINAEAIKKHATGEVESDVSIVVNYGEKVKTEMAKVPDVEQAFSNVAATAIAEALIRKLNPK